MSELEAALATWRDARTAAAAERVDEVGHAALAGWQPPTARTAVLFHAAWLDAAARVETCGWAADALLVKLPGGAVDAFTDKQRQQASALARRLRVLQRTGPDPRVGRAVARLLVQWPLVLRYENAAMACLATLAAALDARTVAEVEQLVATSGNAGQRKLAEIIREAWPTVRPPPPPSARAAAAAPRGEELDVLWAEVRARPDDDDARHVLADALQRRSDPRGELFALQLSCADPARVQALVKAHGVGWLGGLTRFAERVQFARGCVARLELARASTLTEAGWDAARAEPELATVEDLLPGHANSAVYARMLTAPALIALRRVQVYDRATAAALAELPARLEHVAFSWMRGSSAKALAKHVVPALRRQATLRSVSVPLEAFATLADSELLGRLRAVTVAGALADVLALWPRLPVTTTLVQQRGSELDPCFAVNTGSGQITLARETGDAPISVYATGGAAFDELAAHLEALPRGVRRVELAGARPQEVAAIRAAAGADRFEIVEAPAPRHAGALSVR